MRKKLGDLFMGNTWRSGVFLLAIALSGSAAVTASIAIPATAYYSERNARFAAACDSIGADPKYGYRGRPEACVRPDGVLVEAPEW